MSEGSGGQRGGPGEPHVYIDLSTLHRNGEAPNLSEISQTIQV